MLEEHALLGVTKALVPHSLCPVMLSFNCGGYVTRMYEKCSVTDVLKYLTLNRYCITTASDPLLKNKIHVVLWQWISYNQSKDNDFGQYENHYHCVEFDPSKIINWDKPGYKDFRKINLYIDAKPAEYEESELTDGTHVKTQRFIQEYVFIKLD